MVETKTETPATLPPPQEEAVMPPTNPATIKFLVHSAIFDLLAADKISSSACSDASSLVQFVGQGITLGDLYNSFKIAKGAAQNGMTRLSTIQYSKEITPNVLKHLEDAKEAFQLGAMLRIQVADEIMEWLDTHKPSLEASFKEKSHSITVCMAKAVVSLTGAMSAAGYTTEEIKAELKEMSGDTSNPQPHMPQEPMTSKKKKK